MMAVAVLDNSAKTCLNLPVLRCMIGILTTADYNALSQFLVMCLCDKPTPTQAHHTD